MNGITGTRFRRGAPIALAGGLRMGGTSAPFGSAQDGPVVEEYG
jgi:hypothetical protein